MDERVHLLEPAAVLSGLAEGDVHLSAEAALIGGGGDEMGVLRGVLERGEDVGAWEGTGVERSGSGWATVPPAKRRDGPSRKTGMRTGEGEEDRDDDRAGGEPATGGRARSLVRV